ncbi:MAG: EF-hand domain-containing protein [Planctomycetes bacterium]|nr:EF-hand domain-containing protein [Planctomycetota bacterium]
MPNLPATLILLLAAGLAGPAQRGGKPKPGGEPAPKPAEADTDVAKQYFDVCDYDADGWITISEARPSLGIDRAGFALYDKDGDGRISPAEFAKRYEVLTRNAGAFPAPIGKGGLRKAEAVAPADLALRYDQDGDATLDRNELRAYLGGLRSRVEIEVALAMFDADGSRRLEKDEIAALNAFLDPNRRSQPRPHASSIEELFGKSLPREPRPDTTQIAPRIVGPVSLFRRLDLDQNGRITYEDLLGLRRPIQLPVRIAAVVATLDTSGDGAVDAGELEASMAGPANAR